MLFIIGTSLPTEFTIILYKYLFMSVGLAIVLAPGAPSAGSPWVYTALPAMLVNVFRSSDETSHLIS